MRKCKLCQVVPRKDPKTGQTRLVTIVVYSGTQRTHMQRRLDFLLAKGENAWIECDPPRPRRALEDTRHG